MTIENTNESAQHSIQADLDRIARALDLLEQDATRREAEMAEMATLRARHRRLKDTVSRELQQLDLLLANLPQKP